MLVKGKFNLDAGRVGVEKNHQVKWELDKVPQNLVIDLQVQCPEGECT